MSFDVAAAVAIDKDANNIQSADSAVHVHAYESNERQDDRESLSLSRVQLRLPEGC